MRARGFVTFRLREPVRAPTALFAIEQGTVLQIEGPDRIRRYQTTQPYAIVTEHSAVEVEVESVAHGVDGNLVPGNTFLVIGPTSLRTMNQAGNLDVHNAQEFVGGTDDQMEVARPAPLIEPIMGDAAPAWNDSMRRITDRERARERQRADPRQQIDVNGNTFYIDAQTDGPGPFATTLTVTSASSDDSIGRLETGDGASYTWNPVTNQPEDTSVQFGPGVWTTWFHGRGLDHEGGNWVWKIRGVAREALPCPECDYAARMAAERGHMVVRCALCRRQIMVVPAHAAEAEPVAPWTREPTLREVWAD